MFSEDPNPATPTDEPEIVEIQPPLRTAPVVITLDSPNDDQIEIKIRRISPFEDMIEGFQKKDIGSRIVKITLYNFKGLKENGYDQQGLFKEALTMFWNHFYYGYTEGESEKVPNIKHELGFKWRIIASILKKGYEQVGYFPIKLSPLFMEAALFGEVFPSEERLLEALYSYLSPYEADHLKRGLLDMKEADPNEITDVLSFLKSNAIPETSEQLRQTLIEISYQKIIQTPKFVIDEWQDEWKNGIWLSKEKFKDIYITHFPSVRNVLRLLPQDDEVANQEEANALTFLKKFVKSNAELTPKLLRFITGADVIVTEKIQLSFTKEKGLQQRFVAHLCGNLLEIPSNYKSYQDFALALKTQLESGVWDVDII